jgi:signal transduction histidine kinase
MDQANALTVEDRYRAFLRSRWPSRTRALALHAFCGSLFLFALDVLFTRAGSPAPPPLWALAAARLPWMVIPVLGWAAQHQAPGWRRLPALVVMISVLWTWGNAWAYFAAGLAGSPVQAIALVLCIITTATFLPLRQRARAGVFAAMVLGQVALDLAWPAAGTRTLRLATDAAMIAVAAFLVVVFENFAESQRRGLELRHHLEQTVVALEASRARAAGAARAVGQLAAQVAHDVNNPLSAVKVNVRWLADPPADQADAAERAEALADALGAVERIARIVAELRRQAAAHDPDAGAADAPARRGGG